jgi:hypothetical protein
VPEGSIDFVIGADGYMAQYETLNYGDVGAVATPEPGSLLTWSVLGLIGITAVWRRRKRTE